ncbi:chemotaxis protein CheW [Desulfatitalea tepidiphila]|uniref:chemotaxis protein CheW n=1 Tax=Desulfatitalea tepidiphila TaxID=1185843 RepID=UPI0006B47CCB|nr:chemotaxis protein CheW [Desulfatitalea tepidiphila]
MTEHTDNLSLHQYLTFRLGEEMFALDVSQVREILDVTTITKVPRSPAFMRGVINVRGSVVPVVDLSLKFGMKKIERTLDTRIVVMEISLEGEITVIGALADAVHNVMEMEASQIEAAPKIGAKWNTEFIRGIGKHDDEFIIILDVDRIFSVDELSMVQPHGTDAQQAA